jgi:uncharacterized protein with ParB-like and HNH nuclease domain
MNISPETKKISEIFSIEGDQKYRIPIYQRNYSWGTKQIETLIDDIKNEEELGYYIGNLLITDTNSKFLEVVDGQQRLTTIALLFLAIYEHSNSYGIEFDKDKGSLQEDIRRKLLLKGSLSDQRYELLNSDNLIFSDLLKVLVGKKPRKWGNRRFYKRYKEILDKLMEDFLSFNALKDFYDKLNGVEILRISVTSLNDAYSIFSALNSKGLALTLVDLLKNEYLKLASEEKRSEEDAMLSWNSLVSQFSEDHDLDEGEVTQFLLNNYDSMESTINSSTTKRKALDQYNSLLKRYSSKYIDILSERAEWFRYLKHGEISKHNNESVNSLVRELVYLDASQAFPLLMFLFLRRDLELNDRNYFDLLNLIKKFFVVRNVTLRPKASNVRSMFVGLNRYIQENNIKGNEIVKKVQLELIDKVDSRDEFLSQLINDGLYDKNKSTTRYILISLERNFGDYFNKSNPDTLEAYVETSRTKNPVLRWTIEHILPQGVLPQHWINELKGASVVDIGELQEEYVHKIGNLTLTPYNSELGQKKFVEKRDQTDGTNLVGLQLNLFLNKSIHANESWANKASWTIEDIDRRTRYLAEKVADLFSLGE